MEWLSLAHTRAASIRRRLLAWYRRHARDLPWRHNRDPYRVWLAEIMLQQTRVETVIPYYARFLDAFPGVCDLARAPEDQVLKLWEGLGYYRRARNLHRAAQVVAREHGGHFPETSTALAKLPGVGRYTAGAIASIAFGERVAAVDGNAKRVLARLFNVREPVEDREVEAALWQAAQALLPRKGAGDFNQALMDLSAGICLPRTPKCLLCPLRANCAGYASGDPQALPVRRPRRAVRERSWVFAVVERDGRRLLCRRVDGLLGGLWGFPGGACEEGENDADALARVMTSELNTRVALEKDVGVVTHAYTHFRLLGRVFRCRVRDEASVQGGYTQLGWFTPREADALALSNVDRKVMALLSAD